MSSNRLVPDPRLADKVETLVLSPEAIDSDAAPGSQRTPAKASLDSRRASEIDPEKIEWVWKGRIAIGKHTTIAGEPGTGKSQLAIHIAAKITRGGFWPLDEGETLTGSVIILSAEDGAADTIVPRLIAAGANLAKVTLVNGVKNVDGTPRSVNLQSDIALLDSEIQRIGDVVAVFIDPVSSYLGKIDSHKNSDVRSVLEPLSAMAERHRVAIVTITHFSKVNAGTTVKALHRFIGSIAFTGAPRVAFAVLEDKDRADRRLFLNAKTNIGLVPQGLAYRLEQFEVGDGIVTSRIVWETEAVQLTADAAMVGGGKSESRQTNRQEAMDFLAKILGKGPVPEHEIRAAAEERGLSQKVLRSAREALGVTTSRQGFGRGGKSIWSLDKAPSLPIAPINAQPKSGQGWKSRASMDGSRAELRDEHSRSGVEDNAASRRKLYLMTGLR